MDEERRLLPGFEQALQREAHWRFVHPEFFNRPVVFGTPVTTGPVQVDLPRAIITNADDFITLLRNAKIGEDHDINLQPTAPVTISLTSQEQSEL